MEIDNLNGQIFELWKLEMEVLLVDKEQWVVVDPSTKPIAVSKKYWNKFDRKVRSTIFLCLSYLVLLNVSREDTA